MGKKKSSDDKQLYSIFNLLKKCSDNESDFSRIISYSFFDAMSSYKSRSRNLSDEQIKFNEIKKVYKYLENNINACIVDGSRKVSLNLIPVEKVMSDYATGNKKSESKLLETIVNSNSFKRAEKNFSAYVELRGDRAYRTVLNKGKFKGTRNILLNDYDSLLKSFV